MFRYSLDEEQKVREFWSNESIAKKFKSRNKESKNKFYMMDGPPYATEHIHLGTALNKTLKDVAVRYKTMRGYDVFARGGYDTHGLPIENKVQKEFNIKDNAEIERMGIDKFVDKCIQFATGNIEDMNQAFDNLGVWMDFSDPYMTLNPEYVEGLWTTFKKAHEKELLYKGKYPVHVSTVFGTAVAYNEIIYKQIDDRSIYVKFKVLGKDNEYLVIWTTTPWSLLGNSGIMVNPDFEYSRVEVNGEVWIIAKDLVESLFKKIKANYKIVDTLIGKTLEGIKYTSPLLDYIKLPKYDDAYRVILSKRYVTLDAGTGLVHCAPAHGKEDYEEGTRESIKEIIADLKTSNALVFEEIIRHDYPTCWRSEKPLLMIALPQWFFKVSAIKDKLIEQNKGVNWVPHWGEDRFHDWLTNLSDWPVSRNRYWGTPLPIWECDKCSNYDVFGTFDQLEAKVKSKVDRSMLGVHRPLIDSYTYKCDCGGVKKRVKEVLDVWFDSGATSWGALKYPHEKEGFDKYFPADINIEGKDQFRGWWNSQAILGQMTFEKIPFKNVMIHGMVLDINKREMHKSWGNAITPEEVIEKYNRDYLRYFLIKESRGEDMAFGYTLFKDVDRFANTVTNISNYLKTYLDVDMTKFDSKNLPKDMAIEDKWIVSRLNSKKQEIIDSYDSYKFYKVPLFIEEFLSEDLSKTYLKLIKDREDKQNVSKVLSYVFGNAIRLLSPIMPHYTEFINLQFNTSSLHLSEISDTDTKHISKDLEANMDLVFKIVQSGLKLREDNKLRLRWTLPQFYVTTSEAKLEDYKGVIANMLNASEIVLSPPKEADYSSIESEGYKLYVKKSFDQDVRNGWIIQEIRRAIQDERKNLKFNPTEVKNLSVRVPTQIYEIVKSNLSVLQTHTNTIISLDELDLNDSSKLFEVLDYKVKIEF